MQDSGLRFPGAVPLDAGAWGVPALDPAMQAEAIALPVVPYGSVPVKAAMPGTFHFYVADRKFTRLVADPGRLLATGCRVCVEANFSTHPFRVAEGLATIAVKRRLARFWQDRGVRVLVDLNVDPCVLPYALLGVPRGWRSYATRSHRYASLDAALERHALAAAHAGTNELLFVVVGGGKAVKDACAARGWHYVPEHVRVARGVETPYGGPP